MGAFDDLPSEFDDIPGEFDDLPDEGQIDYSPTLRTLSAYGKIYPVLEAAGTIATGMLATPIAGVAGIGAAVAEAFGADVHATDVIHDVQRRLTYKPYSDDGTYLLNSFMLPFEALDEFNQGIADRAFEATDSPIVGAATKVAADLVPAVAGAKGLQAITKPKSLEVPAGKPAKPETFIEKASDEQISQFLDAELDNVKVGNKSININFDRIDSGDNVKAAISEVGSLFEGKISEARREVITNSQTIKLADQLGMTPEQLISRRKGQAFNAEEAFAARTMLVSSAEHLVSLAEKVKFGGKEDLVKFQEHFERHSAIQKQVSALTAEAGRALQQFRIKAKSDKAKVQALDEMITSHGGRGKIEDLAGMISELDSHQKINTLVREAKVSDYFLEAWINALLSGPQTHAVNMTSNGLVATWTIPEQLIASGLSKLRKGDEKVFAGEALQKLYGMVEGGREGLIAAKNTWLKGEPSDLMTKIETPKNYDVIPGIAGDIIRLPGRALLTEDEFFKTMGYTMELNARAFRQAKSEGLKGRKLAERVTELKRNPSEEIELAAIDAARYQTFTKPLGPTGQAVQSFSNAHPAFKLLMPFIRTPTNIIKFFGERSPLGLISKEVRKDLLDKGPKGDIARARMAMGTTVSSIVAKMAAEGLITGGGPQNPDARATKYATGWQPYSVKIGDTYHAYSRLEPLGMLFGTAADFAEISGYADQKEADEIAAAITLSVARNLTSKTWLKGVSDFIEATNDPQRYGEKFVQGYMGTLIPTGVAQLARNQDPVLRRTDDVLGKIKSRIPGYSKDLLPKRNVWGDPIVLEGGLGPDLISPVYVSRDKQDKTTDELVRLEVNMKKPGQKIGPVDLTPELHDELIVLTGKNTKKILDIFVKQDGYDPLPDGLKAEILSNLMSDAKKQSKLVFLSKHPELITQKTQAEINKLLRND